MRLDEIEWNTHYSPYPGAIEFRYAEFTVGTTRHTIYAWHDGLYTIAPYGPPGAWNSVSALMAQCILHELTKPK